MYQIQYDSILTWLHLQKTLLTNKVTLTVSGLGFQYIYFGGGGIIQATSISPSNIQIKNNIYQNLGAFFFFLAEIWQTDSKINKKVQGTQNNQKNLSWRAHVSQFQNLKYL